MLQSGNTCLIIYYYMIAVSGRLSNYLVERVATIQHYVYY